VADRHEELQVAQCCFLPQSGAFFRPSSDPLHGPGKVVQIEGGEAGRVRLLFDSVLLPEEGNEGGHYQKQGKDGEEDDERTVVGSAQVHLVAQLYCYLLSLVGKPIAFSGAGWLQALLWVKICV
jgi:hypothetical protein